MKTLLQINASLFSGHGQSTRLNNDFVAAWQFANPQGEVVVRNFATEPIPHLTAERFQAFLARPEDRNMEQQLVAAYSDALIEEIREADVLVIGLPMYNFGIPSMLQSYFDHIARVGVTFRYTETGPVGLLTGKKAFVFTTRGGVHAGTSRDVQIDHVRNFLSFVGISDIEIVYAEGLNMGEASKEASLVRAKAQVAELTARVAANEPMLINPSVLRARAA